MVMTLYEMIERIRNESTNTPGVNVDQKLLDSSVLIELILPRAFEVLTQNVCRNADNMNALRKEHSVDFVSGVADFPDNIKEEYIATIYFKNDPTVSFAPQYQDLALLPVNTITPMFSVVGTSFFYYKERDAAFGAYTGTQVINAVTIPTLPDDLEDDVDLKDNLREQVISLVVNHLIGKSKLPGLDLPLIDNA